jgi:hypothetical protein
MQIIDKIGHPYQQISNLAGLKNPVIATNNIGGLSGYSGVFPSIPHLTNVFPYGWPAIATAALLGIVLNFISLCSKRNRPL